VQRASDSCGVLYEAIRPSSKFHSPTCRKRASRGAITPKVVTDSETASVTDGDVPPIGVLPAPAEPEMGEVESALLEELAAVDRTKTSLGRAALALARRVDSGRDTGAGMASLVKQLAATSKDAVADVKSAASPLDRMRDELAERRSRGA
jgi:ABC-type transporter Mla subunit MlaD